MYYIRAIDQPKPIGPMSLSAAESIVRATALAQRSNGSRVWFDAKGRLLVKEMGLALVVLWVSDDLGSVIYFDGLSESIGSAAVSPAPLAAHPIDRTAPETGNSPRFPRDAGKDERNSPAHILMIGP